MRRVLLTVPVLASLLLAIPTARGAAPASGTVDHGTPSVTWSGTTTLQMFGVGSGLGCIRQIDDPTCDTYSLTIPELTGVDSTDPENPQPYPDDVLIGIQAPAPTGTVAEYDLYVSRTRRHRCRAQREGRQAGRRAAS